MTEETPQSVASTAGEGAPVVPAEETPPVTPEVEPAPETAPVEPTPEPTPEQQAADEVKRKAEKTQKRINSLTGQKRQAEDRARKMELENAELKGRLSVQPAAPAEQAPPKPGKLEDYENHDDWLAAHRAFDRHQDRIEMTAQQEKASSHAQEEARRSAETDSRQKVIAGFTEREEEARAKYDDYDVVVNNEDAMWNNHMREVAMGLPNGPDVVYHLGRNPDEANRIAQLDPTNAAVELGAIGARLADPSPKPTPKVTSAPDPVVPVNSGGGDTATIDPDKMTNEQYRVSRGYEAKLKR